MMAVAAFISIISLHRAHQHRQSAFLIIVKSGVERLRCIGDITHSLGARAHLISLTAQAFNRIAWAICTLAIVAQLSHFLDVVTHGCLEWGPERFLFSRQLQASLDGSKACFEHGSAIAFIHAALLAFMTMAILAILHAALHLFMHLLMVATRAVAVATLRYGMG
jgi:hypothetical protein